MEYNQKDLLLSIHAEYAKQIVNGLKIIELRRKFPLFKKEDKKEIFVYACSPISKIIGKCDLKEVKKLPIEQLWKVAGAPARIDWIAFQKYFKDCDFGFALYLKNPIKYKQSICLKKVLGIKSRPPQSYRYIISELPA